MPRRWWSLSLPMALVASACASKPVPTTKQATATAGASNVSARFCIATVTEWEVHRCVYELSPDRQKRRGFAQRLRYENGKFVGFDEVNGLGVPVENSDRVSSHRYEYAGNRVASWTSSSRNGVVRGRVVLEGDGSWVRWLDEKGRPSPEENSKASGYRRTFDAKGRVTSYTFVDAVGTPTRSANGRFQVRASRNEAGALYELAYYDEYGRKMRDRYGVHRETRTLGAMDLEVAVEFFDEDGQRVTNDDGVHRKTYVYDDVGNTVEWAFFDAVGERTRSREEGAASVRVWRDEHGNETMRTYFDELGRPTTCAYGYVTRKRRLDEHGDPIEWSFFDADGRPMRSGPKWHAVRRVVRDERGNEVRERYFDVDGRPMLYDDRYHEIESVFDDRGNPVFGTYKDEHGKPYAADAYYASWSYAYDGDRRVETTFLDVSNRPVETGWGYARSRTEYGAFGTKGATTYFDLAGRRSPTRDECPPHAGDPVDLAASLEPLLECSSPDGPPFALLSLAFTSGKLTSAAFLGLTNQLIRDCLEEILGVASYPNLGRCARATIHVGFASSEIKVLEP